MRADGIAPPEPAANKRKANEDLESDEDEGEEEEEDHADETDAEKDEQELKTWLVSQAIWSQETISLRRWLGENQ